MNRRYTIQFVAFLASLILILPSMTCNDPNRNESLDMPGINIALTGRLWRLECYEPTDGTIYRPDPSEIYTLEFGEDFTLVGDYDCNECSGTYELGPDNDISLSFVCTDMACDTQPESPLTIYYLPSLYGTNSYEIRTNQLLLHYRYVLSKGTLLEGNLLFSDTSSGISPNHE